MENIDYNGQKDLHITCYLLAPCWIPTPKGKWLTKFKKINKTKPRNTVGVNIRLFMINL